MQLCTTKLGREICRNKKVYPIIREMHKAEASNDLEKPIYDLVRTHSYYKIPTGTETSAHFDETTYFFFPVSHEASSRI